MSMAEEEYVGCCTLPEGHNGGCLWTCSDCNGTGNCPMCGGSGGEDDVVLCDWCQGAGGCDSCYDGTVGMDL